MKASTAGAALATAIMAGSALLSSSANADTLDVMLIGSEVIYTLNGFALSDGGVLSGSITISGGGLATFDLKTSGGKQPSEEYTSTFSAPSVDYSGPPTGTGWDFFAGPPDTPEDELQLVFSGDLLTGAKVALLGGVNGPSFECYDSITCTSGSSGDFAIRYVGSLATTPLPASWTMMLIGLAGFGFVGYRKSRKGALPVAA